MSLSSVPTAQITARKTESLHGARYVEGVHFFNLNPAARRKYLDPQNPALRDHLGQLTQFMIEVNAGTPTGLVGTQGGEAVEGVHNHATFGWLAIQQYLVEHTVDPKILKEYIDIYIDTALQCLTYPKDGEPTRAQALVQRGDAERQLVYDLLLNLPTQPLFRRLYEVESARSKTTETYYPEMGRLVNDLAQNARNGLAIWIASKEQPKDEKGIHFKGRTARTLANLAMRTADIHNLTEVREARQKKEASQESDTSKDDASEKVNKAYLGTLYNLSRTIERVEQEMQGDDQLRAANALQNFIFHTSLVLTPRPLLEMVQASLRIPEVREQWSTALKQERAKRTNRKPPSKSKVRFNEALGHNGVHDPQLLIDVLQIGGVDVDVLVESLVREEPSIVTGEAAGDAEEIKPTHLTRSVEKLLTFPLSTEVAGSGRSIELTLGDILLKFRRENIDVDKVSAPFLAVDLGTWDQGDGQKTKGAKNKDKNDGQALISDEYKAQLESFYLQIAQSTTAVFHRALDKRSSDKVRSVLNARELAADMLLYSVSLLRDEPGEFNETKLRACEDLGNLIMSLHCTDNLDPCLQEAVNHSLAMIGVGWSYAAKRALIDKFKADGIRDPRWHENNRWFRFVIPFIKVDPRSIMTNASPYLREHNYSTDIKEHAVEATLKVLENWPILTGAAQGFRSVSLTLIEQALAKRQIAKADGSKLSNVALEELVAALPDPRGTAEKSSNAVLAVAESPNGAMEGSPFISQFFTHLQEHAQEIFENRHFLVQAWDIVRFFGTPEQKNKFAELITGHVNEELMNRIMADPAMPESMGVTLDAFRSRLQTIGSKIIESSNHASSWGFELGAGAWQAQIMKALEQLPGNADSIKPIQDKIDEQAKSLRTKVEEELTEMGLPKTVDFRGDADAGLKILAEFVTTVSNVDKASGGIGGLDAETIAQLTKVLGQSLGESGEKPLDASSLIGLIGAVTLGAGLGVTLGGKERAITERVLAVDPHGLSSALKVRLLSQVQGYNNLEEKYRSVRLRLVNIHGAQAQAFDELEQALTEMQSTQAAALKSQIRALKDLNDRRFRTFSRQLENVFEIIDDIIRMRHAVDRLEIKELNEWSIFITQAREKYGGIVRLIKHSAFQMFNVPLNGVQIPSLESLINPAAAPASREDAVVIDAKKGN